MQGGPALALAMVPAVAAVWPSGRRFISLSTAVVAVYLGVCSYCFPDAAGAFGEAWTSGPGPGKTLADPDWRNVQLMASSGESTWDDHQDHQSSRAAANASSPTPWVVRVM